MLNSTVPTSQNPVNNFTVAASASTSSIIATPASSQEDVDWYTVREISPLRVCPADVAELPDPYDLDQYVTDWDEAFSAQPDTIQWQLEPLIERGTANVIYSDAGVGKSLISLELAASIAQCEPVIYIDSENRKQDHVERLTDMGYGPEKLRNLIMVSFPQLPALDTARGGEVLLAYAKKRNAGLVIIDTTMRFVDGKENDADTFNSMYRHTMLPLKGAGITTLRLDHEGKDASRGQRGSSGKRGDVDSVWRLTHNNGNRWLDNEKTRTNHYPDKIRLEIIQDPHLAHAYHWDRDYMSPTAKTKGLSDDAELIATLGITSRRGIQMALADKGLKMGVRRIEDARLELGFAVSEGE